MQLPPAAGDLARLATAIAAILASPDLLPEAAWGAAVARAARAFVGADWTRLTLRAAGRVRSYEDGACRPRGTTLLVESDPANPGHAVTLACRVRAARASDDAQQREELLALLQPALAAAARERLGPRPTDERAARLADALADAAAVYSAEGEARHESAAFARAIPRPPDGAWLRAELARVAREAWAAGGAPVERDVHAAAESFQVTARRVAIADGAAFVLLSLRPFPVSELPDPAERLRATFGLTRREVQVARLLLHGASNGAVAGALGISPATARHHTEHVLRKLGARSRAGVAAALLARR